MHEKGMSAVLDKLRKSWKDIELHTAVTGSTGTGKSSFINAIRGLYPEDPGAAEVGNTETTTECQRYEHPDNHSFIVWDLPGVGTPEMPQEVYLERVEFKKYDFLIIMSKDRFTNDDLWLAKAVQKQKKVVFFVRSNIDTNIANHKRDYPKTHDDEKELNAIRMSTEKLLQDNGIENARVFLISNCERKQYDFGKLNDELLASCDDFKKDSMSLSLAAITKNVLKAKRRVLQTKIRSAVLDIVNSKDDREEKRLFKKEIKFYQKQFSIDDSTLAVNKDLLFLSDENIQAFTVVFDDDLSSGKEKQVTTPTAERQGASLLVRLVDFFRWTDENKLLYKYCKTALEYNLDELCQTACSLYDVERSSMMVHAID